MGTDPQKDYLLLMIENLKGKIIDNVSDNRNLYLGKYIVKTIRKE